MFKVLFFSPHEKICSFCRVLVVAKLVLSETMCIYFHDFDSLKKYTYYAAVISYNHARYLEQTIVLYFLKFHLFSNTMRND